MAQTYQSMTRETMGHITHSTDDWKSFLTTSARLYKYSFTDQLMIYRQKPNATACASIDLWNEGFNRWVKKGSKGIALFDQSLTKSASVSNLRYVFDIGDTENGYIPKETNHLNLWTFAEEHTQTVIEALSSRYDTKPTAELGEYIQFTANELALQYAQDFKADILSSIQGSYLEELDEFNILVSYTQALAVSMSYGIMTRMGIDPDLYIEQEDFLPVFEFNTKGSLGALGCGISELTEQVLREIEVAVKTYEQQKVMERSTAHGKLNLFTERGLPHSQHRAADTASDAGQIRSHAEELSGETPQNLVYFNDFVRDAGRTSSGSGTNGHRAAGTNDEGSHNENTTAGQEPLSNSVGGPYEPLEDTSGGNLDERIDLQLSSPLELDRLLLYSSLTVKEIDCVLQQGGNQKNSTERILLKYAHNRSADEIRGFIQDEYRTGGKGLVLENKQISSWWDQNGLLIGNGKSALQAADSIFLTWEQVEARIRSLVEEGQYLSAPSLEQAEEHERMRLASSLIFAYRDAMPDTVNTPLAWEEDGIGFPTMEAKVASLLSNTETRTPLLAQFEKDYNTLLETSPNSRRVTDIHTLLLSLKEWQTPATKLPLKEWEEAGPLFVTDDEVNRYFSPTDQGFYRMGSMMEHFFSEHTDKETTDFLKELYGTGGSTHALSGADNSYVDYSPTKGIQFSRGNIFTPDDTVTLKWEQVAKRTQELIRDRSFFTQNDLMTFQKEYIPYQIAQNIFLFYDFVSRNTPANKLEYPYDVASSFYTVSDPLIEKLVQDNSARELYATMKDALKEIPTTLKGYEQAEMQLRMVEDFIEGTLDIIPYAANYSFPEVVFETLDHKNSVELIETGPVQATLFPSEAEQMEQITFFEAEQTIESPVASDEKTVDTLSPVLFRQEELEKLLAYTLETFPLKNELLESLKNRPRSKETHTLLKEIYGSIHLKDITVEPFQDTFSLEATPHGIQFIKKSTEHEPIEETLPWAKVQKQYVQMIQAGTLALSTPDVEQDNEVVEKPLEEKPEIEASNYVITDDLLGVGGAKQKCARNISAIETLKTIEQEGRAATKDEQELLSSYVGWGGLSGVFNDKNRIWTKEYAQLKDLLSDEEYTMARKSTLSAYYTPPVVVKAMYSAIEDMGFEKGKILEPALGTGNFFGLLPETMQGSSLSGVELDSISGRIAKVLYPSAQIDIMGFEKTNYPANTFDLVVGNVPFGDMKVFDPHMKEQNFNIHDYFLAKSLEQVRPGGVIAFITSHGTMDKKNPMARKYLAERADLLGAIRLPNDTFSKNAGTDVTSDIVFLQKRDTARLHEELPDWVHMGENENGVPMNQYFIDHPEMVLGEMVFEANMYGSDKTTACHAWDNMSLEKSLEEAIQNLHGQIFVAKEEEWTDELLEPVSVSVSTHADTRNYSFCVQEGDVFYRENETFSPVTLPQKTMERIKGLISLRDCAYALLDAQLNDVPPIEMMRLQNELSALYDVFSAEFGLINATANKRAFSDDSSYYLLSSLEILDEEGNFERKSDVFTKRTIHPRKIISHVDTSSDALAVSIGERGRIDMDFMQFLTGFSEEQIYQELKGTIFRDVLTDPNRPIYEIGDAFLSGNVRQKLVEYENRLSFLTEYSGDTTSAQLPFLKENIEALKRVQPTDLTASEIYVNLGTAWLKPEYIHDFTCDLLKLNRYQADSLKIDYAEISGEWSLTGGNYSENILSSQTYGTSRASAFSIIRDSLNLKDTQIFDTKTVDGKDKRVLNKNETTLAAQKQDAIKTAFKEWIYKDADRRNEIVQFYNERFNSIRPREYDGQYIRFEGMTPDVSLETHQKNAIARTLYGGNTLLAHVVGAGKSFEMFGSIMESKRLGICTKSMIAVPKHLTEQTATEFLRLYPSANLLVATTKDFEKNNRKRFCARIATGDYDAVIIGHSQLEKIPISKERQISHLEEQIREIVNGIALIKYQEGKEFTVKQMERAKNNLEVKLAKLTDDERKDDVVTFEQLGVDRLYVDEAHSFKNLFLYTKMRNVAGITTTEAQKSSDLFMKCRYLDEITGNKGVVFATGTPISNSITEMYTMQRYLQYDRLKDMRLSHFDSWASTFGEQTTTIELAPEGSGYRARTRFAKFHNLPDLMSMFKEVADIKTADMLDLPRPKAHYNTVLVKPSQIQKDMVQELSERAKKVQAGQVDPSVDNMLTITNDGRKIGLDQRLMNPLLPDFEGSKVNACANDVFTIWNETKADRLTQLIFSDLATPNKDGRFNVYDDIREKLVAKGVPREEVAFIHEAGTEAQKKELFAKVRQGAVRVLFGSTAKMGSGTNVQDRLIHLHDLDCPWRPSDLEQRSGRIERRGNLNPEVYITRYVTEGTFDAYLYQTLEIKQRFISQVMTSKSAVRSCEDVDESALSYAEIKALCAGNPLIKEKMDLDIDVARIRVLKSNYQSSLYQMEDDLLHRYPKTIAKTTNVIESLQHDQKSLTLTAEERAAHFHGMVIDNTHYPTKKEAGEAIIAKCKTLPHSETIKLGRYAGLDMELFYHQHEQAFYVTLFAPPSSAEPSADSMENPFTKNINVVMKIDPTGNINRIDEKLDGIPSRIEANIVHLENTRKQCEIAEKAIKQPFEFEQELEEKTNRLTFLDTTLRMENQQEQEGESKEPDGGKEQKETEQQISAKEKPSILLHLKKNELFLKNKNDEKKAAHTEKKPNTHERE